MVLLIAALIIAGAIIFSVAQIVGELRAAREESSRARSLQIVALFAPAAAAGQSDPRALLVWHPLARLARLLFPVEFAALERAAGGPFPFGPDLIESAHARWTSDWLAWERTHDADYKLKAAAAEEQLAASGGSAVVRARLDAIDREKLELYQRRYEEYVRVAKALQALTSNA